MQFAMYGKDVAMLQIPNTFTYLEMLKRPNYANFPREIDSSRIRYAINPDPAFFRYVYSEIGKPYSWFYYDFMRSDAEIYKYLSDPSKEVYYLYHDGQPVGLSILDYISERESNLAYFGLVPRVCGFGLGTKFLKWSVSRLWYTETRRVWVYTTKYDSPAAIPAYQKVGFQIYQTVHKSEFFPVHCLPEGVE